MDGRNKKQIQIARNVGVPEYNELDLTHIRVLVDGLFGIGLSKMSVSLIIR